MNKKKITVISLILAFVLIIGIAAALVMNHKRKLAEEAERLRIYNETYLVVDGAEYRRDSVELDLSGLQIVEFDKLQELTALQQLDLRNTGITAQQYDSLHAALPNCEILWSVPFQGDYYDCYTEELTIDALSGEDLTTLQYLTKLSTVHADNCRDYDALFQLMEQHPDATVTYTVTIAGQTVAHNEEILTVTDPDAEELFTQIPYLPGLQTVNLEGSLPDNAVLIELKETFPHITFAWDFTVCGVKTNSLAESLNLSKIKMDDTTELEAALPCFYNLTKVDMVGCGLGNSAMEKLNMRHPKTNFVWKVMVNGVSVRTDIKYFMFYKYGIKKVGDLSNLRYCTEIEVLDFGHFPIRDVSFIEYMPKLRFLLVLQTYITDLSTIGNCTSLEFLELSTCPIDDFWPLTNLTNLKALNLSHTPFFGKAANGITNRYGTFGDLTPLLQMSWLERLWVANSRVGEEGQKLLKEALPATEMVFYSISSTDKGWRYAPGYYEMRDILDLWYMVH